MRRLGLASTLVVLPDCQHGLTDKVCFFDWMLLVEVEVVLEVVVVEVVMVAMLTMTSFQVVQEAHQWIKAALCMLGPDEI